MGAIVAWRDALGGQRVKYQASDLKVCYAQDIRDLFVRIQYVNVGMTDIVLGIKIHRYCFEQIVKNPPLNHNINDCFSSKLI